MLGRELRRRSQLDPLRLPQRPLGEDRKAPHRLDLVAEELDPDRLLLGSRIDVEDPSADRELPALLDLVDPLVAGVGEQQRDVVEVDALAAVQRQRLGPLRRVRNLLGERDRTGDDHRRRIGQRVHGGDPQPGQVGRRVEVGLEGGPARRVEMDGPGREERLHVAGQVASGAVIGRDDQGRARGLGVVATDQGGEQVGAQGGRDVGVDRAFGPGHGRAERAQALVLIRNLEECSQRHSWSIQSGTTNARIGDPGRFGPGSGPQPSLAVTRSPSRPAAPGPPRDRRSGRWDPSGRTSCGGGRRGRES